MIIFISDNFRFSIENNRSLLNFFPQTNVAQNYGWCSGYSINPQYRFCPYDI